MQLTPLIAVHMTAAIGAVVTGPIALWARRGRQQRPRLHRAFGHAWVTLMIATAVSALFIRDFRLPNMGGYTFIHLLVPLTLGILVASFYKLAKGQISAHAALMQRLYIGACLIAGAFTLLPGRYLGNLLWGFPESHPIASFTTPFTGNNMLLQLIVNHPEALGTILRSTPSWVWGLFAGLLMLGLSQVRDRTASLARVSIMPIAMTVFSVWGTVSAFGSSPQLATLLGVWLALAGVVPAVVGMGQSTARYDAASRSYALPGSWAPLALIMGIFLTKYIVGVELAMQPQMARDSQFALAVSALYGVFSGLFAGRAARLWRLALRRPALTAATAATA